MVPEGEGHTDAIEARLIDADQHDLDRCGPVHELALEGEARIEQQAVAALRERGQREEGAGACDQNDTPPRPASQDRRPRSGRDGPVCASIAGVVIHVDAKRVNMAGPHPFSDAANALSDVVLRTLAEYGTVRSYPKHTVLISEGDSSNALYVVLSGRVRVYATSGQGREITLNFAGPGDTIGEMALSGEPRSASVVTIEPTTCLTVPLPAFREAIARSPDL